MEHVCLHTFRFNTKRGAKLRTEARFDYDPRTDKPDLTHLTLTRLNTKERKKERGKKLFL